MGRPASDYQRHTLFLRRGDWDFLESLAGPKGIPTSHVVRTIVSNRVDELRGGTKVVMLELDGYDGQ